MPLQIGIVGLPNVGKSTLFNALTKTQSAQAENYPFCTIDPNVGVVEVPDKRIDKLTELVQPQKTIPTIIEFVDIAGLVKGASEGEGLGNQFLANIRECDAIAQVVRLFEDGDVIHVDGKVDPKNDLETIITELILADLQTIEKRTASLTKQARSGDKVVKQQLEIVGKIKEGLEAGKMAVYLDISDEEKLLVRDLHLITFKPLLYVVNVDETQLANFDKEKVRELMNLAPEDEIVPICAKLEHDMIEFSDEEKKEYLQDLGVESSGLDNLIRAAYHKLGLITYFTAGEKEVRAWTVKKGATAPQSAGVIHTDFERGFICAETIAYEDFAEAGSEQKAKENGKMRREGKDYITKDGDMFNFRFNV